MKINIGEGHKHGNPGTHNARSGKVVLDHRGQNGAIPNKNMGDSQVKGKPGVRNPRNGKQDMPDVFATDAYAKGTSPRGDMAVHSGKQKMGNPGNHNPRRGHVNKHSMEMGV